MSYTDAASALLRGLGAPDTEEMRKAVVVWFNSEGGPATNPLNVGESQAAVNAGIWYSPGISGTAATIRTKFPGIFKAALSGDPEAFLQAVADSGWAGTHYANQALGIPNRGQYTYADTRAAMAKIFPGLKAVNWGQVGGPYLINRYRAMGGLPPSGGLSAAAIGPVKHVLVKTSPVPIHKGTPIPKIAQHYVNAANKNKDYIANVAKANKTASSPLLKKENAARIGEYQKKVNNYTAKATTAIKRAAAAPKTVITKTSKVTIAKTSSGGKKVSSTPVKTTAKKATSSGTKTARNRAVAS